MESTPLTLPRPYRWAVLFALLTLVFGFGLGAVMGVVEGQMKTALADAGKAALESAYKGDAAAMDAVVKKSWEYVKRAHLHGGAIGTAALACIWILARLCRTSWLTYGSALALGIGGLGYSIFWLLAAYAAPELGSTGAAKESLAWLAKPTSGLCMLGLLGTVVSFLPQLFARPEAQ